MSKGRLFTTSSKKKAEAYCKSHPNHYYKKLKKNYAIYER